MSHFAKVVSGLVVEVIVADQAFIDGGLVGDPSAWVQTSYNTHGGVHCSAGTATPDGGTPLRANYAGVGFTYDATNDVFHAPQPYPSWTIAAPSWIWQAPIAYPTDGNDYVWNEATTSWVTSAP